MEPIYATQTSSGSTPWHPIDWMRTPIQVSFAVRTNALSSNWTLEITMDDVTNTFASSAPTPLVFSASAIGGPSAGSSNAVGAILQPFAAWRLTLSSTGGSAMVTALQAG